MFTPFDANSEAIRITSRRVLFDVEMARYLPNAKIAGQKNGTCSYFLMKETEMVWMDPLNYVWEGGKRAKRFKVVHLEGKNIFVMTMPLLLLLGTGQRNAWHTRAKSARRTWQQRGSIYPYLSATRWDAGVRTINHVHFHHNHSFPRHVENLEVRGEWPNSLARTSETVKDLLRGKAHSCKLICHILTPVSGLKHSR